MALDMANLCDFEVHELLVQLYMDCLLVPPPPGYARPSYSHLKQADELFFRRIAKACRKGVRAPAGGVSPFQDAVKSLLHDPEFRLHLMPLPASTSASSGSNGGPSKPGDGDSKAKRKAKQLQAENDMLRAKLLKTGSHDKGRGKGKDKNKGKKGTKGDGPRGLEGKNKVHTNGDPLCFNFNLRGCPDAKPGQKCGRGWHVCAEPGCLQAHSLLDHR